MKNYITIAALLAAGTAFANAADYTVEKTVWTMNFGSEYTNGYQLTGTLENKGTIWDVTPVAGGTQTSKDKRVHMAGGGYGSWSDNFQLEISLTLGETISASNGWPVFAALKGGETALRFGPYTNDGNYVSMDGSLDKNNGFVLNQDVTVAPGGTYTVTLVKIGTDLTLYVDGAVACSGTYTGATAGNITDIALGGNTDSTYRINETVHSVSYSTVTPKPVPEPSAFGLLAGLGALALVASRRRRK